VKPTRFAHLEVFSDQCTLIPFARRLRRRSRSRRRVAVLWRGDEAARRSATPETSRFKAVFAALADVGVDAEPVVYEDDLLDEVRAQLATFDGVLVWVNPVHEGRNRVNLDALLREVAARGVWVSAHPDVILKMGTKEVLHRTRMMNWGCDTALYRTVEAMRVELPSRLAAGPRVIKRNRGNGGQRRRQRSLAELPIGSSPRSEFIR
jgi:hypothetical protein